MKLARLICLRRSTHICAPARAALLGVVMQRPRALRRFAAGATAGFVLCAGANDAAGATCSVNAAGGAQFTTIQAAVDDAACSDINVAAGIYNEHITISRSLNIIGAGAASTIVDGTNNGRVFTIDSGTVSLTELTVRNGRTPIGQADESETNDGGDATGGGGILNAGNLTLTAVAVSGNSTGRGGDANFGGGGPTGGRGGSGGGIFSSNTLTLQSCTVTGNSTGPGGRGGDAPIAGGPGGTGGHGGGISSSGTLTIQNSTVSGNSTGGGGRGGDGDEEDGGLGGIGGYGGGISSSGTQVIQNSTVSGNSTGSGGQGGTGNFYFLAGRQDGGGGIGGSGGAGGGIHTFNNSTLQNSTVSGNSTGSGGQGGATTFTSDPTDTGAVGGVGGPGGGIAFSGSLSVQNSTVASNLTGTGGPGGTARGGSQGGSGNGGSGGGVFRQGSGPASLANTIAAVNTVAALGSGPDWFGTFTSQGHNLIGRDGGATITGDTTGNIVGTNAAPVLPRLAPLGFYGGVTYTHALLSDSPAVNAGNTATSPATDQRGAGRVSTADIGAFELNSSANGGSYSATLPDGFAGAPYSYTITADRGAFSYSLTGGALPSGLTITTSGDVVSVSGTPTVGGTFQFSVTGSDGTNSNVTDYTLTIIAPDTAPPETAITSPANGSFTNSTSATISFTGSDDVTPAGSLTYEGKLDSGAFAPVTSPVTLTGLSEGSHTYHVRATDQARNVDPTPASVGFTVDTTPPSVSINQAVGQADPTNAAPINFRVVFSETVTGFTTGDVALSGTAGATTATVTGSGTTYNVAVTGMAQTGTVTAAIAANAANDAADNGNTASTSTDNSVLYDITPPNVTVNQAAGQSDPTVSSPINFTVIFSESVSGFDNSDVTISGTAGPTSATVTGSGTTYNVAVSGMTTTGTVMASIAADRALDAAGNGNTASSSTDNSVTYVNTSGQVSVEVNSTADTSDGVCAPAGVGNGCTLREAIDAANLATAGMTITFNIPNTDPGCASGLCTIKPASNLPAITKSGTTIDGYTQPGASANTEPTGALNTVLKIVLSGQQSPPDTVGLKITTAAATVRGLVINGFGNKGVELSGAGAIGNSITGNFIGTDAAGTTALANDTGVLIFNGATNNRIGTDGNGTGDAAERNLISGNGTTAISIATSGTSGNIVAGNFIGTNAGGTTALPNANGILFQSGAANNRVGTNGDGMGDAAERNIISGNSKTGMFIHSAGSSGNIVAGNYIGTNAAGTAAVANSLGISIYSGATDNRIGTNGDGVSDELERNLLSGNVTSAIDLQGIGTTGNTIAGNYIGTNAAGTAPLANKIGISIQTGATNNRVGTNGDGTGDVAERNLVSGNNSGILIQSAGTSGNIIAGNYVGTNAAGTAPLANIAGIGIQNGATNNRIGTNGDDAGDVAERNLVSGNSTGMLIQSAGTSGNIIAGNYFGTNAAGTAAVANVSAGIFIFSGVNNRIGGTLAAERNVISGNGAGVRLQSAATVGNGNIVTGNFIGTDATGTAALANTYGIDLNGGATNNRIGTNGDGASDAAERNLVSGNTVAGIIISEAGTSSNVVAGNFIGTAVNGTAALANGAGMYITKSAANNRIGGTVASESNLIAFNLRNGIVLTDGAGTVGNSLLGNTIFENGQIGIDLDENGVTPNDAGDGDAGTNNLQNFPVLTSLTNTGVVTGTLDSPSGSYRIEFFANTSCDGSGNGEGQTYLGFVTTTGANSTFTSNVTLPAGMRVVTATATNSTTGDTSEFSACFSNSVPVASGQTVSANEDTAKAISLIASDADNDGLTYTVLSQPTQGSLSGTAPNLTYTPNPNYSGPDSFTFKANDGQADSNTATVSITVSAVNDPPVANAQSVSLDEDTAKAITLTGSDVEGNALTFSVVTGPANGALSGTAPNLTYTPNSNYNGSDSFTFKANDGQADSNTATVSLTVNDVPEPTPTPSPTASPTPAASPSPTATASPTPSPTPSSTLAKALNISARVRVETGENVMIGGFIITGNAPKKVILRAIGPSLAARGLADVLADPVLALHGPDGSLIIQNDNWKDTQQAQIEETGMRPQNDLESAIVATLQPGNYTAIVRGQGETTGVVCGEIYDLDPTADSQLANISTRALVQQSENVLIGGFILGGKDGATRLILRAIGPSLASSNVSNALPDPTLDLRNRNGERVAFNDDWMDDPSQAAQIAASGIPPSNERESAIAATLPPGAYTVIVVDKNSATGLGLVEVYNVR